MKKEIKIGLIIIYAVLYITTIFLMFFATGQAEGKRAFKGSIAPWSLMIVMSIIGFIFLEPWNQPAHKTNPKLIIFYAIVLLLNILIGVFSLFDILGVKNYAVTSVLFLVVPLSTFALEVLRK